MYSFAFTDREIAYFYCLYNMKLIDLAGNVIIQAQLWLK